MTHWRNKKYPFMGVDYKSGFEAAVAEMLHRRGVKFEYEKEKIPYNKQISRGYCGDCGSKHLFVRRMYTPDFFIANGTIIEVKGNFKPEERTKHKEVRDSNPERDIRMLFKYDNWITKKKKMRYSEWCEQQNIPYHVGLDIPDSWVT